MATFTFDSENRTPWNNKIFPGNYVAHLNAYRDQGVVALPGAVFFRGVGALVLNPDTDGVLTDNVLVAATGQSLQVLSPDLRQDDKPRLDRPFVIPAGAVVYRTAVNAVGVREETVGDGVTITVSGITTPAPVAATAEADGYFNPVGEFSLFASILDGTGLAAETPVTVDTAGGGLIASVKPSAGACRKSPSAIIVEVCYFMPDAVADADDLHIPYAVEAGQGY
jgi:hypothetical protein